MGISTMKPETNKYNLQQPENELQLIIVWTRHGARAPMYNVLQSYDQWWVENYSPEELTTIGQRSTESKRAVRSAESLLHGLIPVVNKIKQNEIENLKYSLPPGYEDDAELLLNLKSLKEIILPYSQQTFSFLAPYSYNDHQMSPENSCPSIQKLRSKAFKSQIYKDFEKQLWDSQFYDEFINIFSNDLLQLSIPIDNYNSKLNMTVVGWFMDSILCDQYQNIPLQNGISDRLLKKMQYIYDIQNLWKNFPNRQAIKLMASNSMRAILNHITDYIKNQNKQNVILYSGHDGNIITLLQFLGVLKPTFDFYRHQNPDEGMYHSNPSVASSVIFELYKDYSLPKENLQYQYTIRIIYNAKLLKLKFCQRKHECTLKEFERYIISNTYDHPEWLMHCKT